MSCQSVRGIEGTVTSTRRATTLAFAHAGSIVATRATLARTAMIFAARSEPKAIVLVGTETLSKTCLMKRDRGYLIALRYVKRPNCPLAFDLWSLIKEASQRKNERPKAKSQRPKT